MLTTRGYAVLFAVTPLQTSPEATRPTADVTDQVLRAVNAAIATGRVDPNRLGIFGFSQGMREALEVLTETDRFRAAFAGFGLSDALSAYGSSDMRTRFSENDSTAHPQVFRFEFYPEVGRGNTLGVPPWVDPNRYLEHSPVTKADRIHTPLLIANSDLDGFPVEQGSEIFSALHRLNREAEYVTYWGEPHGPRSPANIRDFWTRIIGWYDRYMSSKPSDNVARGATVESH
jgi:dipeptidyl aminopeptidase/acylaminoacyl peptidase